jgi:hypothetical protein
MPVVRRAGAGDDEGAAPARAGIIVVISCGACGHVDGVLSAPTAADGLSVPNLPRPA